MCWTEESPKNAHTKRIYFSRCCKRVSVNIYTLMAQALYSVSGLVTRYLEEGGYFVVSSGLAYISYRPSPILVINNYVIFGIH